jgi:hypothetical protein
VDLETFIVTVFCWIDDELQAITATRRVRQRGPAPRLHDSEVLTMEVVGEYLGLDTDVAIYQCFRRDHTALFPTLRQVHRTTFARQAANLWGLKEQLWQRLVAQLPLDPTLSLVDSVPVAVCRFAHAPVCRRLREEATFGYDVSSRTTFYGLRCHLRVSGNGVIVAITMAPANVPDIALLPELVEGAAGLVLADRVYWNRAMRAVLQPAGIDLQTPFRKRSSDPTPARSRLLNRVRRRIETTAGQLVEHYHLKRVWARDTWHLTSRVLRKVLSHTLAVAVNYHLGAEHPLRIKHLVHS